MNQQLRKDLSRIDPIVAVVIFGVGFAYLAVHQSFIGFGPRLGQWLLTLSSLYNPAYSLALPLAATF